MKSSFLTRRQQRCRLGEHVPSLMSTDIPNISALTAYLFLSCPDSHSNSNSCQRAIKSKGEKKGKIITPPPQRPASTPAPFPPAHPPEQGMTQLLWQWVCGKARCQPTKGANAEGNNCNIFITRRSLRNQAGKKRETAARGRSRRRSRPDVKTQLPTVLLGAGVKRTN